MTTDEFKQALGSDPAVAGPGTGARQVATVAALVRRMAVMARSRPPA